MTDKKFTDEEIIKALMCHFNEELDEEPFRCVDCPLYNDTSPSCTEALKSYALDLINRQKAELADNERLNKKVDKLSEVLSDTIKIRYKEVKAEAYKEFAERLKERKTQSTMDKRICTNEMIDNLLKEMIGE